MDLKLIQKNNSLTTKQLDSFVQGEDTSIDLNIIGNSIFFLEEALRTQNITKVQIPTYQIYNSEISDLAQELILEATNKKVIVEFYENPQKRITIEKTNKKGKTCLFSCGIDSFSGIFNAQNKFGNIFASMTHHQDYRTLGKILRKQKELLKKYKIPLTKFTAPEHKTGIRYSRGILYTFNGLSLGRNELIISECGTTMFQPKFAPFDTVTKTTNPELLLLAKQLAEKITETKIKFIEPNANLTKAEIISSCPEKKLIEYTHSCWTSRWCSVEKTHEGNCYGCITRQIGEIVAGIKDKTYRRIPFEENTSTDKQLSELIQLIRFSHEFLTDHTRLPDYSMSAILRYGKVNLFERTSHDTIAALYLLDKEKKLKDNLLIKWLRKSLLVLPKEKIENRVSEVRENKYKPDFENILKSVKS